FIIDRKPSVTFFHIFGSICYIVKDGENLDKMKEKGDECIFVGYSSQSRAYRVFNKRTRVIMKSIHVNFDELPHMASDQISSDPAPECQTMALEHNSLSPTIQRQENVPHADRIVTTSNELGLLFSPMFDELLNGSSKVVSKSSAVSAADAPTQHLQHTTLLNNHITPASTYQVPTLAPSVTSSENINQAETYAENDQVADDEFINIFCTPVQNQGETSSRHVDSSNMHTFYQRYPSEHRWTKDHPLEQVIGNPSQSVRTRRQLESNAEMFIAQSLPTIKKSILKNTNVLAPGMYKLHTDHTQARTSQLPQDSRKTNKHISFSTRVISTTSVSRPQLKSNPMGDSVMHNSSQGKKQEVEDQRRSVKSSKNKTYVTACNDSLNVNTVCATCDTCVLKDKHDMCVLNSVDKPLKKIVASESNKKPRNITRKLYERVRKTCSWWYPKFTPSGYKWKPKSGIENVNSNVRMPLGSLVEIVLFIVDSGCSKHMTGNLKLLINFVEKFLGTVKFRNDQIAPILRYGDLVQGAVTIKWVYYVEGFNHNLFSVGQFCDADLEVAFRKSTCYIHDLKGNDLLTASSLSFELRHHQLAVKE
nr:Gag-Pol polyprotein [Tanacetum cinerariifolium]